MGIVLYKIDLNVAMRWIDGVKNGECREEDERIENECLRRIDQAFCCPFSISWSMAKDL